MCRCENVGDEGEGKNGFLCDGETSPSNWCDGWSTCNLSQDLSWSKSLSNTDVKELACK